MANFVLVYTGGSMPATEAERGKVMEAWGSWFGKLGDNVVDAGNPFGQQAKNVSNGGAVHDGPIGTPATGYSILKADSLDAAVGLAKGCPVLTSGGKITVYEVTPAM
ncbi:MAG: YciI family protein [Candidatus Dormibacteraeota bacterium]|nr:YciI family protein [Candidatus Dormibacteraeota bacterium]